jgi:osmotically-inducible protein OsmY
MATEIIRATYPLNKSTEQGEVCFGSDEPCLALQGHLRCISSGMRLEPVPRDTKTGQRTHSIGTKRERKIYEGLNGSYDGGSFISRLWLPVSCQAIDDAATTAKIKAKLAADSQTSAIKIDVETNNGAVTLTGTVPSEQEKAKAAELATDEPGVKRVIDNIHVNPNSTDSTNAGERLGQAEQHASRVVDDDAILAKIKSKLIVADLSGVHVDVSSGQVVLTGTVKDGTESTEAETLAKDTDGVTTVKNQLSIGKG